MAEDFFRVHKGITVANTSASANLIPNSLIIGPLTANTTGVYSGIVNATSVFSTAVNSATFSVGTAFTANALLVNCAAINISGAVNVGSNVRIDTIGPAFGNSTVFVSCNSTWLSVKSATAQLNVAADSVLCGVSKVNTTTVSVTDNVVINTTAIAILGSKVALLATEDQVVAGGARVTVKNLGTISSGTVTPDPGDRPMMDYTNNGAHILAPGSNFGCYLITIVNSATAGAITTSGWNKVTGDTFTTTNGSKFRCHCSIDGNSSLLLIQALQ